MIRTAWVGVVLSAAVAVAPCQAQPETASPRKIEHPIWTRRPTGEDIARVFPHEAAKQRVNGGAVITCTVTAEGRLGDCQVSDESPLGLGFGDAALKLGQLFKMKPLSADGEAVAGATIRIPIRLMVWN